MTEITVVGAGLSGCAAARVLAESGFKVKIYEKRKTVGGNVYDYIDGNGVRVQEYGPHIFHTNDKAVFDFLSRFTSWTPYEHRVLGNINGKLVPVPFNLTSLFECYPKDKAEKIKSVLVSEIGMDKKVPILELKKHSDPLIRDFAEFVYKNIFYTYTLKQWGFSPLELGEAVMNRVPVYVSYEDRYFTDKYQFMPSGGFTPMIEKMLEHENITVVTDTDALEKIKVIDGKLLIDGLPYDGKVIYTARLDELFENCFGELSFRSLDFKFETLNVPSFQPAAVVNYNTSEEYTRISEFNKFACAPNGKNTVIVREYSKPCKDSDVPYYPIPTAEKQAEFERYRLEAQKIDNLYLLGRLAAYKYVNMDLAVKSAMELAEKIKEGV